MAAPVIITMPLIVLVLIFQRRVISGLSADATKGSVTSTYVGLVLRLG